MDKSETWIKMCDKVPEDFPGKHSMEWGDYYAVKNEVCIHFGSAFCILQDGRITKLYRQDQLQEMVSRDCTARVLAERLAKWINLNAQYSYFLFSMEQLWVAFVMKEKYNKVWNGEAWNECH